VLALFAAKPSLPAAMAMYNQIEAEWARQASRLPAAERECLLGAQVVAIIHPAEVTFDGE
jgi:hypothetical protein